MDEQGIYCPQCHAYVHFWLIPTGGRSIGSGAEVRPAPGTPIDMPQACGQCGYKSVYKTSDLRTRRVPTEPARLAMFGPAARQAATMEVPSPAPSPSGGGKDSGSK